MEPGIDAEQHAWRVGRFGEQAVNVVAKGQLEGVGFINLLKDKSASLTAADLDLFAKLFSDFVYDVLGLGVAFEIYDSRTEKLKGTINLLIEMRDLARANRNYSLSDQIRDRLAMLDILLKDGENGTTFDY